MARPSTSNVTRFLTQYSALSTEERASVDAGLEGYRFAQTPAQTAVRRKPGRPAGSGKNSQVAQTPTTTPQAS